MMVELLSVLVLTFSLTLIVLGFVGIFLERGPGRWHGGIVSLLGLAVGAAYSFLASRYSLTLFGRLIVEVDLPALVATAVNYVVGMLVGIGLSGGLFLWITGRYRPSDTRGRILSLAAAVMILAVVLTLLAVLLSRPPA
jgi:hypothetical protein